MKCYNLSRKEAANFNQKIYADEYAWISIQEPLMRKNFDITHTVNEHLDNVPNIKVRFWDITSPAIDLDFRGESYGEPLLPMTEDEAKEIVDFCLLHKDKNIIANCMAGKCRSGAICQFLQDMLRYEWDVDTQRRAVPNSHVYKLLCNYFLTFNAAPVRIIDKRHK